MTAILPAPVVRGHVTGGQDEHVQRILVAVESQTQSLSPRRCPSLYLSACGISKTHQLAHVRDVDLRWWKHAKLWRKTTDGLVRIGLGGLACCAWLGTASMAVAAYPDGFQTSVLEPHQLQDCLCSSPCLPSLQRGGGIMSPPRTRVRGYFNSGIKSRPVAVMKIVP